jgi:DNA repair exonuclease SbcCD ATPase subunit
MNVRIKRLELLNFKGIRSSIVEFGEGATAISGRNATGKSTIFDAFCWLLFGKNAAGDAKFGVKTYDAGGREIDHLNHEVTGVLTIDGRELELKRVLTEKWVTKRGDSEAVLEGNVTSYLVNGVGVKESEYKAKVASLISEDLFRAITQPLYFQGLKWEKQRELLLSIAGDLSYNDIAKDNEAFKLLLDSIEGTSLEQFKAELAARRRKLAEQLSQIPARIDEVSRHIDPCEPVSEEELADVVVQIESVEKSLSDRKHAESKQDEERRALREKIAKVEEDLSAFSIKFQRALDRVYEENSKAYREYANRVAEIPQQIDVLKRKVEERERDKREKAVYYSAVFEGAQSEKECLGRKWTAVSEEEFKDATCPTCGQQMPADKLEESKAEFLARKSERLETIRVMGLQQKKALEDASAKLEALKKPVAETEVAQIEALESELEKLKSNPVAELARECSKKEDHPEYKMMIDAEKVLREQYAKLVSAHDDTAEALVSRRRELQDKRDILEGRKRAVKQNESLQGRIQELKDEEKRVAQAKADVERQEDVIGELVHSHAVELERRINDKFKTVKFRLFEEQLNGGERPTCVALVNGTPITDANDAARINAGLEIINTFCEHQNVYAPIFIDNAESVNRFVDVKSQLITLSVSNTDLTISNNVLPL